MGPLKLGVFGGTFNPIHLGHLHLARRVQKLFDLDQIHFVVATAPPHKPHEELVDFIHRYAMVSLALAGQDSLAPSPVELDPPSSPFSLHTLDKFARMGGAGPSKMYFIAGGDSLAEIREWHESRELLTTYSFIFAVRAGVPVVTAKTTLPPDVQSRIRDLSGLGPRLVRARIRETETADENTLFIVDVGVPDISASRIRALIADGKVYRHLIPPLVCRYIKKLHLYGE